MYSKSTLILPFLCRKWSHTMKYLTHCTQKKIWNHLMQNIFRNQTVKNLTILDNPFKRYDFSKCSLNSVKFLCRPHKLATVPCHECTTPHWFCTQIITNFQFSWIWVKLLIKLIPKSIQIHIYPKQTWLISRGNLVFTWELYFQRCLCTLPMGSCAPMTWYSCQLVRAT